jgi:16S rRNA (cytosine1407-C5)-methyltransferase
VVLASIGDARRKLPRDFIEELYETYSPVVADKILTGMITDRYLTLRVNTIKYDSQSIMNFFRENNVKFDRVQWYNEGFIIKNSREREIEKFDIYEKGFISFQSLSSMVPPIVLEPKPGERVLDLTAAPGSKTTQIAALMNNEGYILANELDKIRSEKLKAKVEVMGSSIVEVVTGRGEKIGDEYPEYFDRVLLDTPCSGEGRFVVGDASTTRYWSKREVEKLSRIQKKLFDSANKALKKDGIMVYSTCTLNKEENEGVLDYAVSTLNMEILSIDLKVNGAIPGFNEGMDVSINRAIRILPSKEMEGFFICKLRKQ